MKSIPTLRRVLLMLLSAPLLAAQAADAQARGSYAMAQVVRAEPIYRTVRQAVPHEECRLEQVPVRSARSGSATAPVLGAIIGGAVGNAIGSGKSNKRVGAAAGAILGGSIGYDVSRRHAGPARYRTEEVCTVVTGYRDVRRIDGYHVTYRHQGRTYTTRMPYDPGRQLRVRVHVEPVI